MDNDDCCSYFPSALRNPTVSTIFKLNGTNHNQCVESFMMNLIVMKLDLALRIPYPSKLINESYDLRKSTFKSGSIQTDMLHDHEVSH